MTAPPSPAVRLDIERGIATLTLDQPDTRNAMTTALMNGLGDGLHRAIDAEDVRLIVLTNTGPAFCAGANLKQDDAEPPRYGLVEVFELLLDCPKPIIGKIAGHCTGGGVGLAAACDISVAADDVQLGFTEVRIGVAPAVISVVCLPKMRRADASELFLSGEKISAGRAVEVGLLNRAVARDELDAAVASVLDKVARGGPHALAAAKSLITRVPDLGRADALAWTGELSAALFASAEAQEGMRAFRERSTPSWVARS